MKTQHMQAAPILEIPMLHPEGAALPPNTLHHHNDTKLWKPGGLLRLQLIWTEFLPAF